MNTFEGETPINANPDEQGGTRPATTPPLDASVNTANVEQGPAIPMSPVGSFGNGDGPSFQVEEDTPGATPGIEYHPEYEDTEDEMEYDAARPPLLAHRMEALLDQQVAETMRLRKSFGVIQMLVALCAAAAIIYIAYKLRSIKPVDAAAVAAGAVEGAADVIS